ncbi:MAG: HAD-IB family hydrolase [Acidimicrobiales bacterium]|nr:HAD-IB family hydrolase [Acidimicrobiales bacterium]
MSSRNLAAFDFDGTITRRDTLFGFLRFTFGDAALCRSLAKCVPTVARARLGIGHGDVHPRDAGKIVLLRSLTAGHTPTEMAESGRSYASRLPARFRPDVTARLDWHRAEGHDVVIVSASLKYYLEPLRDRLGLLDVLACEMAVGDAGTLTGELARPNVRGPEKEVRLREWMSTRDRYDTIWAYGNSSGDKELLAMADHATMITKAPLQVSPARTEIDRR